MAFGFSWLCLRASGGVGGLRFRDSWLFCTSASSEYVSRLGMVVAASPVSTIGIELDHGLGGRHGSGFSVSPDVRGGIGVVRPMGDLVLIAVLENDNDGSSKDTVCGAFAFTNLPWRCPGVEGLLF